MDWQTLRRLDEVGVQLYVELECGGGRRELARLTPEQAMAFGKDPDLWWAGHFQITAAEMATWRASFEQSFLHYSESVIRCGRPTVSGRPCRNVVAVGLSPGEFTRFASSGCAVHGGGKPEIGGMAPRN